MTHLVDAFPEEILEQIAEALVTQDSVYWIRKEVLPQFKTFRLVCKRFAYCNRVLQVLFKRVRLRPDPKGYQFIEQTDCLSFAKHVERVTFVPPQHSIAMTLDTWREIITAQDAYSYAAKNDLWTGFGSFAYENDGHRKFLEAHVHSSSRTSEAALQIGFKEHLAEAEKISALLRSDELRDQWASTLRAFQNCQNIRFAEWESIPDFHKHDEVHEELTCRRLAGPMGDLVFAAAVESLAKAGTQVRKLTIKCATTGQFGWDQLPGWQDFDLSRLHTLKFSVEFVNIDEHVPETDGSRMLAGRRSAVAITAIMKKCSKSLTKFEAGGFANLIWPSHTVVPLSAMRELRMGPGSIRPYSFRNWLQHMPSLEYMELRSTYCSYKGYKVLFDAIKGHMNRNQPKKMLLHFEELPAADWAEISLRQDLADLDDDIVNFNEAKMDAVQDIEIALIRYMTGLSGWNNAATRKWFAFDESEVPDQDGEDTGDDDVDHVREVRLSSFDGLIRPFD